MIYVDYYSRKVKFKDANVITDSEMTVLALKFNLIEDSVYNLVYV